MTESEFKTLCQKTVDIFNNITERLDYEQKYLSQHKHALECVAVRDKIELLQDVRVEIEIMLQQTFNPKLVNDEKDN